MGPVVGGGPVACRRTGGRHPRHACYRDPNSRDRRVRDGNPNSNRHGVTDRITHGVTDRITHGVTHGVTHGITDRITHRIADPHGITHGHADRRSDRGLVTDACGDW